MNPLNRFERLRAPLLVLLAAVVLAALPLASSPSVLLRTFAEDGPVEVLAAAGWAMAGVTALTLLPRAGLLSLSYGLSLFVLALRETGLPPALVPSGRALLRPAYYLDPTLSMHRRVAMALLLLAVLAGFVHAGVETVAALVRRRPFPLADLRMLVLAGVTLVASQGAEALLGLPWTTGELAPLSLLALEEGLETLSPLLVLAALGRAWYGEYGYRRSDAGVAAGQRPPA